MTVKQSMPWGVARRRNMSGRKLGRGELGKFRADGLIAAIQVFLWRAYSYLYVTTQGLVLVVDIGVWLTDGSESGFGRTR